MLIAAPLLARHRGNPNVQGFVKGAYAAAIGTILGACILLGRIAIGDWLTALIGLVSLAILFRWKVSNPLLIAATAVVGLIAFPLLQPTWVMVEILSQKAKWGDINPPMEVNMTRRKMLLMTAGATVLGLAALVGFADHNAIFADDDDDEGQEALIKLLDTAKINLQQGLAASEPQGQPISAKFEVDDGKLQLSVYTAKEGKFSRCWSTYERQGANRAHHRRRRSRCGQFTERGDGQCKDLFEGSGRQSDAQSANARAVSVVPSLKDGHPSLRSFSSRATSQNCSTAFGLVMPALTTRRRREGRWPCYIHSGRSCGVTGAVALASTAVMRLLSQRTGPLQLEAKIPLGDVRGRIDHMAVDLKRQRLFVAELGNDSVGIVDLANRKLICRDSLELKEPQGVGYESSTDTLYVANAGDGSVRLFEGNDYKLRGTD